MRGSPSAVEFPTNSRDDAFLIKAATFVVCLVIGGIIAAVRRSEDAGREEGRLTMVSLKYSGETASLISKKMFWQGQTADQLMDSLGPPDAVESVLMATRKREIWKYGNDGANRYRTRITLDNDVVTKWTTR
jgi:hypothetical protein